MTSERERRITRMRESVRDVVAETSPDQTRVELLGTVIESLCDDLEIAYRTNETLREHVRALVALNKAETIWH